MNQLHLAYTLGKHNTLGKFRGEAPKSLKINQLDKDTGIVIKTWDCIKDSIVAKVATSGVWRALKDKTKTCGGYKWEYANKLKTHL